MLEHLWYVYKQKINQNQIKIKTETATHSTYSLHKHANPAVTFSANVVRTLTLVRDLNY